MATAVGITTARVWLLPRIDDLKHQLAAELSWRIGQPVRIGRLRADLHHLTPRLRLMDVRIGRHQALRLQEIQVVPDLIASLRRRHLQFEWLRLVRARIEIRRDQDGRWHLLGLGKTGKDGPQGLPPWLLQDGRFELLDTTLILRRSDRPPLVWQGVDASLSNRGRYHRLQIQYRSAGGPAQRIRVNIHFQSGPWQGRFLVLMEQVAARPLAELLLAKPVEGKGNAQFWGHFQDGRLELTGNVDLRTLHWPHRPGTLPIDRVTGTLQLRHSPQHWQIRADGLHLANRDLNLLARFNLEIPEGGSPYLEALGRIFYLDLARLHAYLPAGEFGPVKAWLRDNLKGTAQGRLLWRGRPADFPFADHSGIAEAKLTGHDVRIRFHSRWPALSRATVQLRIHNGEGRAFLKQGRIAGIPIQRLSARLTLPASDPVLAVHGEISAPAEGIVALLDRSPLRKPIAAMRRWIDVQGTGRLDLAIRIPLRHAEDFRIDGRGRIQGAHLRLRRYPMNLEAFTGKLHFDRHALKADITGRIRNQPARLLLSGDPRQTQITLKTRLAVEDWPELAQIPDLAGTTPVEMELSIPGDDQGPPRLQVKSDLRGLGIDRPYPVGKKPGEPRSFRLRLWLDSGERLPFSLDYPPFHAAFQWHHRDGTVDGRIGINQPPPPPQSNAGLTVKGKLDRLNLDPWLDDIQALPVKKTIRLRSLELDIAQLSWHGRGLGAHRVALQEAESGWRGRLDASYARGRWTLQDDRLDLRLNFLDLAFLRNRLTPTDPTPAASPSWPAIHLDCRHLRWGEIDLGRADLRALPLATGLRFDFRLEGEFHRLEGSGSWRQRPKPLTMLSGRFQSRDLGRFLKTLNHDSTLVETPTAIDFRLRYPGPPYGFSPGILHGHLDLRMGPGRWLALEPGAGRLLGLLYLGTLQRRLRLDFSDLFAQGLSYERIHGHIRLAGGHAFTDDLLIEAVPARIFISGSADLDKREIDETVLVVPNTPLTLGLFPQRRGAGSVFQRLFNTPLDTLMQSQYAIYGPWDDPTIVRIHRSLPGTLLNGVWSGLKKLTTGKNHESGQRRRHPNEQRRPSADQSAPGGPAHQPGG